MATSKGVKGQEYQTYVIKGDVAPATSAQYWASLVSQQKYQLVNQAIQIASAEAQQAATTELQKMKIAEQNRKALQSQKAKTQSQILSLSKTEAMAKQREELRRLEREYTGSLGSRGSSGSVPGANQQAREETKLLNRYSENALELENAAREERAMAQVMDEDGNTALAQKYRNNATAYETEAKSLRDQIAAADKNGDRQVDTTEIGVLLPPGSYDKSGGTAGTSGGKRKTVVKGDVTPVEFTAEKDKLQAELDAINAQLERAGYTPSAPPPSILARAAEIAGRTNLGTGSDMGGPTLSQEDMMNLSQRMQSKYFPEEEISKAVDKARVTASQAARQANVPFANAPFQGLMNKIYSQDYGSQPLSPQPENMRDIIQRNMGASTLDNESAVPVGGEQQVLEQAQQQTPAGQPPQQGEFVPQFAPSEAEILGPTDGQPVEEDIVPYIRPPQTSQTPIPTQQQQIQQFNQAANPELDLFNSLFTQQQNKMMEKKETPIHTIQDAKLAQGKELQKAVESGRMKTKEEVRRELAKQDGSEWRDLVIKLYSPPANSDANQRIRMRDNAYQELLKVYGDDKDTMAKAAEFLISLDALEMGALPYNEDEAKQWNEGKQYLPDEGTTYQP